MPERYIVTADPPTPNGDLHVGHLSGPYFAADALVRALRLAGHEVAFLSNYDANQSYVVTTALQLGSTPEQVVADNRERIATTLAAHAVEPDLIGFPDEGQKAFICRFFEQLHAAGKLLVREEAQPYCGRCEHFLFETYIQGTCPHCGTPCYGNGCEICALPNSPKDMGSPRCRHCGEPPSEVRSYRGLFLPLSRTQDQLRRFIETRRTIWRPHFFEAILHAFDRPLPDIPLSVVSSYGVPVSIPGFDGQVYNVRQEILPALMQTFERWRSENNADAAAWRGAKIVHFHGFENVFQYCVSFNTLCLLAESVDPELGWGMPYANLTNEFYLLEGSKFSTTRRHAIWGRDFLAVVSSDAARFYLALTNPEHKETNLELDAFRDVTDRLLNRPWNALHARLGALLADPRARTAPRAPLAAAALERLATARGELAAAYAVEGYSLQRAACAAAAQLAELHAAAAALEPSASGFADRLGELLSGVHAFAVGVWPLMPRFSERLRRALVPPLAARPPAWDDALLEVAPRDVRWDAQLALPFLADVDFSRLRPAAAVHRAATADSTLVGQEHP